MLQHHVTAQHHHKKRSAKKPNSETGAAMLFSAVDTAVESRKKQPAKTAVFATFSQRSLSDAPLRARNQAGHPKRYARLILAKLQVLRRASRVACLTAIMGTAGRRSTRRVGVTRGGYTLHAFSRVPCHGRTVHTVQYSQRPSQLTRTNPRQNEHDPRQTRTGFTRSDP